MAGFILFYGSGMIQQVETIRDIREYRGRSQINMPDRSPGRDLKKALAREKITRFLGKPVVFILNWFV